MDTIFYLISILSFSLGLVNLGLLLLLKNGSRDPGAWSLTLPLYPLLLITFLLILEYYLEYRYPGRSFVWLVLLLEWVRIAVALSWNFISYYHYKINGIEKLRRRELFVIAIIALLLVILVPVLLLFRPAWMGALHIGVIILFYHAGMRAVLITRRSKKLYPSSRAALKVAIISLLIYPAIGIGDPLGWRIPFLNPGLSLWVQGHPIYFTIINIPFLLYALEGLRLLQARSSLPGVDIGEAGALLSLREQQVLELLLSGSSYRQIADTLFISLPTVKSHIQHIYQKLGVKRRADLLVRFGNRRDGG